MKWLIGVSLATLMAGTVFADPWKDKSGNSRYGWYEDRGDTPDWMRGRGYWDGHYQQDRWRGYPPEYYPPPFKG